MDPFIEGQDWQDFHSRFINSLSDVLVMLVRPHYVVRVERRVYVEHDVDQPPRPLRPDLAVLQRQDASFESGTGPETATVIAPVECTLPMPEQVSELFLTIRQRETLRVITVIELLSPSNKRIGSDGRREYLAKREAVLGSPAHLVELDLLRGGHRMPTLEPLPLGEYFAIVSCVGRRPRADAYAWTLHQPLPAIPVPLAGGDSAVRVDLQAAFSSAYDRAGYDYSLRYDQVPVPPLADADAAWASEKLASWHG